MLYHVLIFIVLGLIVIHQLCLASLTMALKWDRLLVCAFFFSQTSGVVFSSSSLPMTKGVCVALIRITISDGWSGQLSLMLWLTPLCRIMCTTWWSWWQGRPAGAWRTKSRTWWLVKWAARNMLWVVYACCYSLTSWKIFGDSPPPSSPLETAKDYMHVAYDMYKSCHAYAVSSLCYSLMSWKS